MEDPEMDLDPVAIALTEIEGGSTIRFTGRDIESGATVSILVETKGIAQAGTPGPIYDAGGLVLLLTIGPMTIPS